MDSFLGEIRIFAGNYPPNGWAFCDGSLLPIAKYTALFSLLGVYYGGDGRQTFALPNLKGSAAMGQGMGPGLSERTMGEQVGSPEVTLLTSEMPAHTHVPQNHTTADSKDPEGNVWATMSGRTSPIYVSTADAPKVNMNPQAVGAAGGNQPHNNMQPFLGMSFIICLDGQFPVRP